MTKHQAIATGITVVLVLTVSLAPLLTSQEKQEPTTGKESLERKPLKPVEQAAFLARRTGGRLFGTFSGFTSYQYAVHDVCLHTESEQVNTTRLYPVFPEKYHPTYCELFDTIARQTGSTWKYDARRDYWVFNPPPKALPYRVKWARGWEPMNRGLYVFCKPPGAPVGMDVYMLGSYSFDEKTRAEKLAKIRYALASRFAATFKKDVCEADMRKVKVAGVEALFFSTDSPKQPGVRWRQWALVAGGHGFVIVSALHKDHEKRLLPDVEAMVASFRLRGTKSDATAGAGKK